LGGGKGIEKKKQQYRWCFFEKFPSKFLPEFNKQIRLFKPRRRLLQRTESIL